MRPGVKFGPKPCEATMKTLKPTDQVRVYMHCIGCKQSWPWAFAIADGLAPRTALAPAYCPKCQAAKSRGVKHGPATNGRKLPANHRGQ